MLASKLTKARVNAGTHAFCVFLSLYFSFCMVLVSISFSFSLIFIFIYMNEFL